MLLTRTFFGPSRQHEVELEAEQKLQRAGLRIVNQIPDPLPSIVTIQPAGDFTGTGKILCDLNHSLSERNQRCNLMVRRSTAPILSALLRDPRPGLLPARGMGSNQITVLQRS